MTDHNDQKDKDIDELSGVETTGHEWDGLKELNNPLPRWWLWVFYATCIWAFGYFVLYPAWPVPGGATKGVLGYTQEKELAQSQMEIFERQKHYLDAFEQASFDEIMNDAGLYAFANAGGKAAFKDNCATCHGSGAAGSKGYPNLNDDDWIWGGTLDDIYTTLLHGIRDMSNDDTRQSMMPAFGRDGLLNRAQIDEVVTYVQAMAETDDEALLVELKGHKIFQENCVACHGMDGRGDYEFGAPNLRDAIWLYGGTDQDIFETIYNARAGMMPAWQRRLDDNTIRQLTVYVHQLGGGQDARVEAVEKGEEAEKSAEEHVVVPQEQDPTDLE